MDVKVIIGNLLDINSLLDEEKFVDAINKLNGIKINGLVNSLIYKDEYTKEDQVLSGLIIRILQNIYNNSGLLSPISDELYDLLYEKNRKFSEIVGAAINNKSNKLITNHLYPDLRGTLFKTYFIQIKDKGNDKRDSIEDFINRMRKLCDNRLDDSHFLFKIMPKFDGVSVIFEVEDNFAYKALTRGDTEKNEAVELPFLIKYIKPNFMCENDFKYKRFGVKTEIIMSNDNFEKFKEKYGDFNSSRSAVSSILNSKDSDKDMLKYLTIIPLQIQDFETKRIHIPYDFEEDFIGFYMYFDNTIDYEKLKSHINVIREDLNRIGCPIDGIVMSCIDKELRDMLGRRDDNINKFEFAYKFPPEKQKSILKNIKFSVGILGAITPVAKVEPVKINGNIIENISLGSMDRFETLKLKIGDEVIVKYDIIPYLAIDDTCASMNGEIINPPIFCPYCNEHLEKDPILKCVNENCECRQIGKILNYINKLAIMNISEATVTLLYNNDYLKDISDLYKLKDKKKKLYELPRLGKKSVNKIIESIESRNTIYDYELLGSLGIPDVGRKIFKKVMNIYYIDEVLDIALKKSYDKLICIDGIGNKVAQKMVKGINLNKKLIKFLCAELTIKKSLKDENSITVSFTKIRDKEFEKFLSKNNVETVDYNKNIKYLIVPDLKSMSNKINKAISHGVKIITIEQSYEKFGYKK